jgi:hypothetical protein
MVEYHSLRTLSSYAKVNAGRMSLVSPRDAVECAGLRSFHLSPSVQILLALRTTSSPTKRLELYSIIPNCSSMLSEHYTVVALFTAMFPSAVVAAPPFDIPPAIPI